ncbi:signal peptidase II [Streptomyces sp. P9(2023)]|uniref:signal peptidase II n=1 Tax=Streptomyces sp. P9(2023) TaxID=3064394 RepID=UPI0028F42C26|nr:signal peptidase II [Streptomyces sp. P9(2023)]MDT9692565.1 signal peptidase II [Streptomyces sp. P9(2023)]
MSSAPATAPTTAVSPSGALKRRLRLLALASLLAGADLGIKAWAERTLPGSPIEAGPLDLQLAFNPGVAFSFAADAPAWTVLAVTGLITAAIAITLWRTARTARRPWNIALAAVLGGALANLIDRAPDGQVTDYLHTGWWPTFNLADVFIVCGGLLIVALSWRTDQQEAA